jgi:hypothetical protein
VKADEKPLLAVVLVCVGGSRTRRDDTWLDRNGISMTSAASVTQQLVPDTELLDYHCLDNGRDRGHMVGK